MLVFIRSTTDLRTQVQNLESVPSEIWALMSQTCKVEIKQPYSYNVCWADGLAELGEPDASHSYCSIILTKFTKPLTTATYNG